MEGQGSPVVEQSTSFKWRKLPGRILRFFGTVLGFSAFGFGGLFIGIFVFPLISVFVRNPDARLVMARRMVGLAFTAFIRLMSGLGVMSYKIEGAENAGSGHKQLIIANHPTLIDVIFLVSIFPLADCVVKEAVSKNLFMRGVVSLARYIPSDDPMRLLETCVKRLKSGASLVLFPEGTRSVPGQSLKFKLGAASIAVKSGAEILPVTIQCSHPRLLAKHEPWYLVPADRPFFSIKIHPPMSLDSLIPGDLQLRQATHKLNLKLSEFFAKELS